MEQQNTEIRSIARTFAFPLLHQWIDEKTNSGVNQLFSHFDLLVNLVILELSRKPGQECESAVSPKTLILESDLVFK